MQADRADRDTAGPPVVPEFRGPDDVPSWLAGPLQDVLGEYPDLGETLTTLLASAESTAAILSGLDGDWVLAHLVRGLLDLVDLDLSRDGRANLHWLRARLLEFSAARPTEAERELHRARDCDPSHRPAIRDLARYRSDRGEARRALCLLRQLDLDVDRDWMGLLEIYATSLHPDVGRNDRCPCRSGRKFKRCCGPRNGWPLDLRIPWIREKLSQHLASPPAAPIVDRVMDAAGWRPGRWTLDPEVVRNLVLYEGGLVADFVETRGALLPADERALLQRWAMVRADAYEVAQLDATGAVTLVNCCSDLRVDGSRSALPDEVEEGDVVLAWIADMPHDPEPVRGALLVPWEAEDAIAELLETGLDAAVLAAWCRSVTMLTDSAGVTS